MQNIKAKKLMDSKRKNSTLSIPISKTFIKTFGFFLPSKIKKVLTEAIKEITAMMMSFLCEVINV